MNAISNIFSRSWNYLSTIGIADILDILIVAYLVYRIILLIQRTNLYNVAKGLMIFILAMWLSDLFNLTMINYILRKTAELGLIALVILFQPELRRLLERVGSTFLKSSFRKVNVSDVEYAINQTIVATGDMAETKTGALIVFERSVRLNDVISGGTIIDAEVSAELLKNIFYDKSPLHDGAVIIRDGRIAAAGCVLPLTTSQNLSRELGMRHRAGLGISEQSDAVVLIVSEETGAISACVEGMLKRHLKAQSVEELLKNELLTDETIKKINSPVKRFVSTFISKIKRGRKEAADEETGNQ